MFREMRRFKQKISDEDCFKILTEQPRGVLSMIGDDGYPYGIPLDNSFSRVCCIELVPEHMTGKLVNES